MGPGLKAFMHLIPVYLGKFQEKWGGNSMQEYAGGKIAVSSNIDGTFTHPPIPSADTY